MRKNTEIEIRWHQDHYLDKAGNLWKRSNPNRLERSNKWSDLEEGMTEEEFLRMIE